MGESVWLRVVHPVTWEEMTSTERDGDNSDSLPAHLSQSWGFDALAVVDGSRGTPLPEGRAPLSHKERAGQRREQLRGVLSHITCDA